MKKLYAAFVFLLLIPVASLFYLYGLALSCDRLTDTFENVLYAAENNSGKLSFEFEKAEREWEKQEKNFAVSVNHAELDTVKQSLARAKSYIKSDNMSEFICELEVITAQIEHIKQLEYPTLQNVF